MENPTVWYWLIGILAAVAALAAYRKHTRTPGGLFGGRPKQGGGKKQKN